MWVIRVQSYVQFSYTKYRPLHTRSSFISCCLVWGFFWFCGVFCCGFSFVLFCFWFVLFFLNLCITNVVGVLKLYLSRMHPYWTFTFFYVSDKIHERAASCTTLIGTYHPRYTVLLINNMQPCKNSLGQNTFVWVILQLCPQSFSIFFSSVCDALLFL